MRAIALLSAAMVATLSLGARAQDEPATDDAEVDAAADGEVDAAADAEVEDVAGPKPGDVPSAESELTGEPSLRGDVVRYPPTSVRYGVLAGGAGMFGVAYALSAISAAAWPGTPGSQALYAPVAGPIIALAKGGCSEDDPDCGAIVYVRGVLYVVDTLVQIGGLALIAEGLFMTTEAEDAASVSVLPVVTPTESGIAITGRF